MHPDILRAAVATDRAALADGDKLDAGAPETTTCLSLREREAALTAIREELDCWDRRLFSSRDVAASILEVLEADFGPGQTEGAEEARQETPDSRS